MIRRVASALLLLATATPLIFAAEPAAGIEKTWAAFQAALKQKSPEALAKISKFPIQSNEFGGPIKTSGILEKRFAKIFTPKTIQCLLAQKPKRQVQDKKVYYEAFCDNDKYPIRFIFEKSGSDFFFTGVDNINE
jgi:hypothetical protein